MLTAFFMHTTHAIHLALGLTLYARLVFSYSLICGGKRPGEQIHRVEKEAE